MIIDLPSTTTARISGRLVRARDEVGAMALTRVLTLVVVVDEAHAEEAIGTANAASRQHPCRIIVVVTANPRGRTRLDAQIRVGGDAGASEVIVLRLYGPLAAHGGSVVTPLLLADSPVLAWWPVEAPKAAAEDPIGAMASRRITDSARSRLSPKAALAVRARSYTDGDTDLAWSRITLWRAVLASTLDTAPFGPVTRVEVEAAPDSPSGDLLAAWLGARLRCPVTIGRSRRCSGIIAVHLERAGGRIDLVRPTEGGTATLTQPGQPERIIALPRRSDAECLADELHRLDADEIYQETLTKGLAAVAAGPSPGATEGG